jgi:hypothetical protein
VKLDLNLKGAKKKQKKYLVLGSTLRTRPSDPSDSRAETGADRAEEGEEMFSSAQR